MPCPSPLQLNTPGTSSNNPPNDAQLWASDTPGGGLNKPIFVRRGSGCVCGVERLAGRLLRLKCSRSFMELYLFMKREVLFHRCMNPRVALEFSQMEIDDTELEAARDMQTHHCKWPGCSQQDRFPKKKISVWGRLIMYLLNTLSTQQDK